MAPVQRCCRGHASGALAPPRPGHANQPSTHIHSTVARGADCCAWSRRAACRGQVHCESGISPARLPVPLRCSRSIRHPLVCVPARRRCAGNLRLLRSRCLPPVAAASRCFRSAAALYDLACALTLSARSRCRSVRVAPLCLCLRATTYHVVACLRPAPRAPALQFSAILKRCYSAIHAFPVPARPAPACACSGDRPHSEARGGGACRVRRAAGARQDVRHADPQGEERGGAQEGDQEAAGALQRRKGRLEC